MISLVGLSVFLIFSAVFSLPLNFIMTGGCLSPHYIFIFYFLYKGYIGVFIHYTLFRSIRAKSLLAGVTTGRDRIRDGGLGVAGAGPRLDPLGSAGRNEGRGSVRPHPYATGGKAPAASPENPQPLLLQPRHRLETPPRPHGLGHPRDSRLA